MGIDQDRSDFSAKYQISNIKYQIPNTKYKISDIKNSNPKKPPIIKANPQQPHFSVKPPPSTHHSFHILSHPLPPFPPSPPPHQLHQPSHPVLVQSIEIAPSRVYNALIPLLQGSVVGTENLPVQFTHNLLSSHICNPFFCLRSSKGQMGQKWRVMQIMQAAAAGAGVMYDACPQLQIVPIC